MNYKFYLIHVKHYTGTLIAKPLISFTYLQFLNIVSLKQFKKRMLLKFILLSHCFFDKIFLQKLFQILQQTYADRNKFSSLVSLL